MRLSFKEMKDAIAKIVPKDIQYDVDLEECKIEINKFLNSLETDTTHVH